MAVFQTRLVKVLEPVCLGRDMLRPANAFADMLRDRSQSELETLEYVAHGGVEGKIILMTAGLAPM